MISARRPHIWFTPKLTSVQICSWASWNLIPVSLSLEIYIGFIVKEKAVLQGYNRKSWPTEISQRILIPEAGTPASERREWALSTALYYEAFLAYGLFLFIHLFLHLKGTFAPKCTEEKRTGLAPGHMSWKHHLLCVLVQEMPLFQNGQDPLGDCWNSLPLYSGPWVAWVKGEKWVEEKCVRCSQCVRHLT